MATAEQTFRAKAPWIMRKLIADFPIGVEDAAAIVGNLGHESLGFTKLQEMNPTVPGSKGGWGFAQWTGPRRRAFEAYCARTGKDPASDEANYAYLCLELKGIEGTEGKAIGKTAAAKGLDAKVEAFEKAFLRAGIKHYDSRKRWARIALDAYIKEQAAQPAPHWPEPPTPAPSQPKPVPPSPDASVSKSRPNPSPPGTRAADGRRAGIIALVLAAIGALIMAVWPHISPVLERLL